MQGTDRNRNRKLCLLPGWGPPASQVPERAQESVPPVRFTQAAKVLEKLLKEASSAVLGSLCDRR